MGRWPNCYRIANGEVDLVVTSDIGPRIMRYGFVDGQNFFKNIEETMGQSGRKRMDAARRPSHLGRAGRGPQNLRSG